MLRKDFINGLILIFFSALMHEFLTWTTIAFVLIGVMLILLQKRPHRYVRNALALIVFSSYWFTYGKVIDPEIGINFLTSVIVLKLLERETERDDYMIFYGLILIVASGSLFVKNLAYFGFFILSFFTLIIMFYYQLGLKFKFSRFIKNILWVTPITLVFFFLTPRLMSPIPFGPAISRTGEVGYRPDVNLSEIDSLNLSSEVVFEAQMDSKLPQDQLYWRGNTLSFTDGWNWPLMSQDRSVLTLQPTSEIIKGIKQLIRIEGKYQFFFGLDKPLAIKTSQGTYRLNEKYTAEKPLFAKFQNYEVISTFDKSKEFFEASTQKYLRKGLTKFERKWIETNFLTNDYFELIQKIEEFFKQNQFTYNLSPGKIQSFSEFISKRTGFCSHFASATALILRSKGIPTRLVSGFHGGIYNPYSGIYTIAQNDAHVWLESFHNGQWLRLDPTLWIVPERIELGGEAFLLKVSGKRMNWGKMPFAEELRNISMWLNQWDFRFYNWLEGMDYHQQLLILKRLNIKREFLISIIPLLIAFFLIIFIIKQKFGEKRKSEIEKLWHLFKLKIADKQGFDLNLNSIKEIEMLLDKMDVQKKDKTKEVFNELVSFTFGENEKKLNVRQMHRNIKSL